MSWSFISNLTLQTKRCVFKTPSISTSIYPSIPFSVTLLSPQTPPAKKIFPGNALYKSSDVEKLKSLNRFKEVLQPPDARWNEGHLLRPSVGHMWPWRCPILHVFLLGSHHKSKKESSLVSKEFGRKFLMMMFEHHLKEMTIDIETSNYILLPYCVKKIDVWWQAPSWFTSNGTAPVWWVTWSLFTTTTTTKRSKWISTKDLGISHFLYLPIYHVKVDLEMYGMPAACHFVYLMNVDTCAIKMDGATTHYDMMIHVCLGVQRPLNKWSFVNDHYIF